MSIHPTDSNSSLPLEHSTGIKRKASLISSTEEKTSQVAANAGAGSEALEMGVGHDSKRRCFKVSDGSSTKEELPQLSHSPQLLHEFAATLTSSNEVISEHLLMRALASNFKLYVSTLISECTDKDNLEALINLKKDTDIILEITLKTIEDFTYDKSIKKTIGMQLFEAIGRSLAKIASPSAIPIINKKQWHYLFLIMTRHPVIRNEIIGQIKSGSPTVRIPELLGGVFISNTLAFFFRKILTQPKTIETDLFTKFLTEKQRVAQASPIDRASSSPSTTSSASPYPAPSPSSSSELSTSDTSALLQFPTKHHASFLPADSSASAALRISPSESPYPAPSPSADSYSAAFDTSSLIQLPTKRHVSFLPAGSISSGVGSSSMSKPLETEEGIKVFLAQYDPTIPTSELNKKESPSLMHELKVSPKIRKGKDESIASLNLVKINLCILAKGIEDSKEAIDEDNFIEALSDTFIDYIDSSSIKYEKDPMMAYVLQTLFQERNHVIGFIKTTLEEFAYDASSATHINGQFFDAVCARINHSANLKISLDISKEEDWDLLFDAGHFKNFATRKTILDTLKPDSTIVTLPGGFEISGKLKGPFLNNFFLAVLLEETQEAAFFNKFLTQKFIKKD